jgi:Schlafen, AlbA_2/PHP domain
MDLHLHTPASVDFREANVTYLPLLRRAEERGLDILAFTDHNTVAGYERYLNEVESLELLERLNRLTDAERTQLDEYRRLQDKLLILPGFELTATLGFHILGIFPPDTSVRELEHLLLNLHVPPDKLDLGSGEVGATSDVLTAYRLIDEAGGLAIAAHANSSHGVAMPGFDFGGQTRVSYTQDPHLHALEVTDLTSKSRRRTALFFSGTKPEYPRRMQLIQSSDAHRLTGIPGNNQELGVGDRATEILIDDLTVEAIKDVFLGNDFARIRPYEPTVSQVYDPILEAREDGETLVQAFHEHLTRGKGIERGIIQDVVALANTNGGTIYVGLNANPRSQVMGVQRPSDAIHQLKIEISKHVVPPLEAQLDSQKIGNRSVIRIIVPRGSEVPYALDGMQIYVRSENETSLAVRDEIVNLVRDVLAVEFAARPVEETPLETTAPPELPPEPEAPIELPALPPRTGVQVIPAEKRRGEVQYSVRDLRNNRLIHNVTRSSARKLWQYAISEFEEHPILPSQVKWLGDLGMSSAHKRAGKLRYDLLQRDSAGNLHIYYGVTEDGIHGPWKALIEREGVESGQVEEIEEAEGEEAPEFIETHQDRYLEPEFYMDEQVEPDEMPEPEAAAGSAPMMEAPHEPTDMGEQFSHVDMGTWIESVPSTLEESEAKTEPVAQVLEDNPKQQDAHERTSLTESPHDEPAVSERPLESSQETAKMEPAPVSEAGGQVAPGAGEAAGPAPGESQADLPADAPDGDQNPVP